MIYFFQFAKIRIFSGTAKTISSKTERGRNLRPGKVYIQSALNVDTETKRNQETFSLRNSGDFFRKIVIVDGNAKTWTDEDGIMYMGVIPFLLEEEGSII